MNNSDHNDYNNWQNGDEFEENNPNNHMGGFFFYGNPKFKKIWDDIAKNQDPNDSIREYLNMDEIMKQFNKPNNLNKNPRNNRRKQKTNTTFTQEEYHKLIEIRGYLAITEQFAHVKALDKLLAQIVMIPIDPREK
jgi:hypothetical protein